MIIKNFIVSYQFASIWILSTSLLLQEVVADDTRAIDVVLASDIKRAKLIKEEEKLDKMAHEGKTIDVDRQREVQEELQAIGSTRAEAKASK